MKTLALNFHRDNVSLKNTDEPTIVCQDLDNIFMVIRQLYKAHLKEIKTLDFESATKEFLKFLVKKYIDNRIDLTKNNSNYCCYNNKNNWKNLLTNIVDHIIYKIDISREKLDDYTYNIKTIEHSIDIEKYTITILIQNIENNYFLQAIICLEEHIILTKPEIEAFVDTKMGVIRFEPVG